MSGTGEDSGQALVDYTCPTEKIYSLLLILREILEDKTGKRVKPFLPGLHRVPDGISRIVH